MQKCGYMYVYANIAVVCGIECAHVCMCACACKLCAFCRECTHNIVHTVPGTYQRAVGQREWACMQAAPVAQYHTTCTPVRNGYCTLWIRESNHAHVCACIRLDDLCRCWLHVLWCCHGVGVFGAGVLPWNLLQDLPWIRESSLLV